MKALVCCLIASILAAAAVAAMLVTPGTARAYPTGACAAPENWPAQTADIYLRTCGISLSDALAKKQAPATKAPAKKTTIKGFMIQGGDPNSKDPAKEDSYGQGGPDYKIKAEFNDHPHDPGVISMARSADPDSAGSQFFICLAPIHRLDHQYTTFGKLIKGDDVLEKIGNTPVERNSQGETSKPTKRVVIESVKIVPADSVK